MARRFQAWLRANGGSGFEDYIVEFMTQNDSMIYGTNSPQLLVTVLTYMAGFAEASDRWSEAVQAMPPAEFKKKIDEIRNDKNNDKTSIEMVSNHWLKAIEGYAEQKKTQLAGEDAKKRAKAASKLRTNYLRDKEVPGRGDFRTRFDGSAFKLDDLVLGMKDDPQFFEGRREKARSVSTHGNPQTPLQKLKDFAIRRACKFLIYDSIAQGKKIAYLLDDLDMAMVAYMMEGSKIPEFARIQDGASEGKVPVCTTEIREIFRRWDYLKGKVQFFRELSKCAPPWEDPRYMDKWGIYAAYRAAKALQIPNLPFGDKDKFKLAASASGANAVRHYLSANPSVYFRPETVHGTTNQRESTVAQ
jgi:hypothetical protein